MPTPTHLIRAVGRRICTLRELRGDARRRRERSLGAPSLHLAEVGVGLGGVGGREALRDGRGLIGWVCVG